MLYLLFKDLLYSVCTGVLSICRSMAHSPEEGVRFPGPGVVSLHLKAHHGLTPSPLEEQPALLPAEPSLQPPTPQHIIFDKELFNYIY